jgi:phosphate transport system protein
MQEHFEMEIESLKNNLIKMASVVDEQVDRVISALETDNIELCRGVKAKDLEVDAYDNLVQTQCENMLALFHPVAVDLRFIMSTLMINNQLERCGDIAVNIGQRIKKAGSHIDLINESQIVEMGKTAKEMLRNSIDSFINNNSELAKKVIASDEIVDKFNKKIFKFLVSKMQSNPELIESCAHYIVMIRHIERLADHATNIAEDLIFYVEARIITHQKKLENREKDLE